MGRRSVFSGKTGGGAQLARWCAVVALFVVAQVFGAAHAASGHGDKDQGPARGHDGVSCVLCHTSDRNSAAAAAPEVVLPAPPFGPLAPVVVNSSPAPRRFCAAAFDARGPPSA